MEVIDEIVAEFLIESHENLDQLDRDLVALEREPGSRELLSSIFRTVHTIKGTCGFLAFGTLESVAHVGESLLARLRDGKLTLSPHLTTRPARDGRRHPVAARQHREDRRRGRRGLLRARRRMQDILDGKVVDEPAAVETAPAEPAPAESAPTDFDLPAAVVPDDASAVEVETDADAEPAAGVAAAGAALASEPVAVAHEDVHDAPPASNGSRRSVADSSIRVDVDLLDELMNLVGELVLTRNQLLQRAATRQDAELQRTAHRLNLIAGELQEGVMKTRMQPIDNVWSKLPRVVRDLCVSLRQVGPRRDGGPGHRARQDHPRGDQGPADPPGPQQRRPRHRAAERPRRRRQAGRGPAARCAPSTRAARSSSRSPTTAPASTPPSCARKAVAARPDDPRGGRAASATGTRSTSSSSPASRPPPP